MAKKKKPVALEQNTLSFGASLSRNGRKRARRGVERALRRALRTEKDEKKRYQIARALKSPDLIDDLTAECFANFSADPTANNDGFRDKVLQFIGWVIKHLPEIIELISIITESQGFDDD